MAVQKASVWCGPGMVLACLAGFFMLAGFVPPPSPGASASKIVTFLSQDTGVIRLGIVVVVFGAALPAPWMAMISVQLKRIEGRQSPLTYLQLLLGACLLLEFILPMMALQAAAFRTGRPDEIVLALSDWGWMTFFGVTSTVVLQAAVIGIGILTNRRSVPLFPRWAGYFNLWIAVLFTPGTVLVFFKSGPLAWNGLFVFWMPFAAFFSWVLVMTWLLLQAIDSRDDSDIPLEDRVRELTDQLAQASDDIDAIRRLLGHAARS